MKNLILCVALLMLMVHSYSQTHSTGVVTLTTGFTVEIEVNTTTDIVTMTLVGPDNRWLGVAFSAIGSSMGASGDDVVVYNSSGLQDRNMTGSNGTPNLDDTQDWTVNEDTTSGGVRTLIATRMRNTGDSNDYVFPDTPQSIPLMWAMGSDLSFAYHNARGGAMATLSTGIIEPFVFDIYPNPVQDRLRLSLGRSLAGAELVLHNNLGQEVLRQSVEGVESELETSFLRPGMYLLQLHSEDRKAVKTLIKE